MTNPISSPVSSTSFPSSTTSRGYDENNFTFNPKAWPTTVPSTSSPARKFVGNSPPGTAPLSIQTNPQAGAGPAAAVQHHHHTHPQQQQQQQQSWRQAEDAAGFHATPPPAPAASSPLPPRSSVGSSSKQLPQPNYHASSPSRLSSLPPKTSGREMAKDPRHALAPRGGGATGERGMQHQQQQHQPSFHSASAAALESLEAVRRQSDTWQQQQQQQQQQPSSGSSQRATSVGSHGGHAAGTRSASSTPLRSRDAPSDSQSFTSAGNNGGAGANSDTENWMSENGEPDDLEQALFEQRLTEDVYGVAVRKINQNGKSNLRYVKCCFVDAADLEVDARGFSSGRSVSSHSRRFPRFRDRSVERSEGLMRGKKVKVLSWGKKKEVNLPLERFVCVRKGKTTERTRRNVSPASRIVSLITDDPHCPSLDIEAPTRLDRDKFAKAFSRFLGVPMEGDDARSIRSDITPASLKEALKSTSSQPQPVYPTRQSIKSQQSAPDLFSGANSHATNNSASRKHIPLPVAVTAENSSSSRLTTKPLPYPQQKKMFSSKSGRMTQQEAANKEALSKTVDIVDTQQQQQAAVAGSLPSSTHDSKTPNVVVSVSTTREASTTEKTSQPTVTVASLDVHHNDEDASILSSITGAGFDQEIVEELHMALTNLRAELDESRAEAARAVKVAEQAIQSAEHSNSKDWNSTVTHKAAEAAALAQKRSAEALAKARMAEERLEQEKKKASIWRKQAETAAEEAGHWQTRAAVAEVQRAAISESLESQRQTASTSGFSQSPSTSVTVESEMDRLRSKLAAESASRRKLLNEVQDLRGAIRVYCRPRVPKGTSTISSVSREVLMLHREQASFKADSSATATSTPLSFEFDGILASDCSQQEVYDEMESVCLSALEGYNSCLISHGQSGTGKTYTMLGNIEYGANGDASVTDYGIHLRAAQQFFHVVNQRKDRYQETIHFNIVEVTNERLSDLLVGTELGETQGQITNAREGSRRSRSIRGDHQQDAASASHSEKPSRLEIKTNRDGETTVHGLLSVEVGSFDDVLKTWTQSLTKRKQRLMEQGVDFEEHESNSHIITSFKIRSKNITTGVSTRSKIQFVDLAASDIVPRRPASNKKASTPEAAIAGIGIGSDWKFTNRSMATLSEVVTSRSQFQRTVPYRNATITHLLSDSLEADTKVVLVACVSSDLKDLQETACALKFAQTVRKVVVGKATKHTTNNVHA